MKKIATLALIAAMSSTASAQSSVTLFGVVDVNVRSVNNAGKGSLTSLSNNGINSGRWGFRGIEDLGEGYKAGFWLESDLFADTGTVNATKLFSRQSTVSLYGPFGELRLGRHYTPTGWFWEFDPWSVIGVGGSASIARFSGQRTFYRSDNEVNWYLPSGLGGIYGQATWAPGEGVVDARYRGARLGYSAGPVNAAIAYGKQDVAGGDYTTKQFGASYDLKAVKFTGYYIVEELLNNKETRWLLGAIIPVWRGEVRTSYVRSDASGGTAAFNAADASLITLGYVHNLSKRTALYGTAARIDNKGGATFSITGGAPGITPGRNSTGYEIGVRHFF